MRTSALLLGLLLVTTSPAPGDDGELTARYFAGLRERGLFGLAEGYCLDRLRDDDLDPEARARLVVELSRTFSEHGRFRVGSERDDLWAEATRVLDEYIATDPPTYQRLLAELQRAFLPAGQGEFLLRQYEASPFDESIRKDASRKLGEAVDRFTPFVAQLETRRREAVAAGRSTPAAESKLLFNARYRLAITRLDLATVSEPGSPDRADLLNVAHDEIKSLASGDPLEESTQRCQVLLARTLRLQGRVEQAVFPLEELLKRSPPVAESVRDEIEYERALVLLSLNRPDEAAKTLLDYRRSRGRFPGELRLAMTRCLIGLWNVARTRDERIAEQALERVRAEVEATEIEVGGYWAVRCRALLELAEEASEMGPELAVLVRRADGKFRNDDVAGAVADYGEATNAAVELGRADLAVRFAFTRASIELDAGRFVDAARHFLEIAENHPTDERAPKASLLGAFAVGRLYDAERSAARREQYVAALEAHRRRFPGDPTAGEATLLLARLHERRLQYTDALREYLSVPVEHERGFESAAGAARMYERVLDRLRELSQPSAEWERAARTSLAAYSDRFPPLLHPLDRWQAKVAMTLARLLLVTAPVDYDAADALLERVTATWEAVREDDLSEPSRRAWANVAREAAQLRVVALAGRGRFDAARQLIETRAGSDPRVVLDVLDGLTGALEQSDDRLVRQLGTLQLAVAEPLRDRRDELDADVRRRLDSCLLEALFATGRRKQAVETASRLLDENSRDVDLRRAVALRLGECGQPDCLAVALPVWRALERAKKPGQPEWFEARYYVILGTLRSGDTKTARKLFGITRTLHPNLGGDAWRERYEAIGRELAL